MASKYRISYTPQLPLPAFEREFDDLPTAVAVLTALAEFSLFEFEQNVKPDYADLAYISVWEDGEWVELEENEWRDDL